MKATTVTWATIIHRCNSFRNVTQTRSKARKLRLHRLVRRTTWSIIRMHREWQWRELNWINLASNWQRLKGGVTSFEIRSHYTIIIYRALRIIRSKSLGYVSGLFPFDSFCSSRPGMANLYRSMCHCLWNRKEQMRWHVTKEYWHTWCLFFMVF